MVRSRSSESDRPKPKYQKQKRAARGGLNGNNNTIDEVACEDSNFSVVENNVNNKNENESMNSGGDYSEESDVKGILNNQSAPIVQA